MPDPIWWFKIRQSLCFSQNWNTEVRGRRLLSCYQTFKIQICGSNMVVKNSKRVQVFLKIGVQGFSRSLIKIFLLDFQNSKWRTKNGGVKFEKSFYQNLVQGFSRWLITIFPSDIRNSRWLSQFGNDKFEKRLNYAQIWSCYQTFKIQNGGTNMVVKNSQKAQI